MDEPRGVLQEVAEAGEDLAQCEALMNDNGRMFTGRDLEILRMGLRCGAVAAFQWLDRHHRRHHTGGE